MKPNKDIRMVLAISCSIIGSTLIGNDTYDLLSIMGYSIFLITLVILLVIRRIKNNEDEKN